jgi:hypothetical protein
VTSNHVTPQKPAPAFTITTSWDDGHPLDFRLAEMLAANGLRATFYIPRRCPPRPTMSAAQVRELSATFEIGAHTLDHVFLTEAGDDLARREIIDSKKWVEDVTGRPCQMFCPPAGKFAERHVGWMREAGYAGLRTVELLSYDPPLRRDGLLEMPTTIHAFPHGVKTYAKNAARRGAWGNLWRYVTRGAFGRAGDWGDLAAALLADAAAVDGVFHLWGHSWELEETAQWQRLGEVLAALGRRENARFTTNGEACSAAAG